mmetsp:Transcript_6473/g.11433  ORF Transcript_6473/g.11433 Transcript_6473/m.11433 type:complete len:441 (+) Transcript_6473:63-1385(+)
MFHHKDYQSFAADEPTEVPQRAGEEVEFAADEASASLPARRRWAALGGALFLQVVSVVAVFGVIAYSRVGMDKVQAGPGPTGLFEAARSGSYYTEMAEEEKVALFQDFKAKYHKHYESDDEEEKRYNNFLGNLVRIDSLNAGPVGATYGITQFSDFTEEELKKIKGYKVDEDRASFGATDAAAVDTSTYNDGLYGYIDYSRELCSVQERFPDFCDIDDPDDLPDTFDWRDYDVVTEMRNQYICGDCWAFAITESMSSQWYLYGNDMESVSAQEMTSCNEWCWGCDGGWFVGGFTKAMQMTWASDEYYPFMSRNGVTQDCRADIVENGNTSTHISGWGKVEADGIEMEMKLALYRNGPMVVAVDATSMEFYIEGIAPATNCDTFSLDHAVTLVGWDTDDDTGVDYWIVKNSWGDIWGEDGYWKVVFGRNSCGISEYAMMTI